MIEFGKPKAKVLIDNEHDLICETEMLSIAPQDIGSWSRPTRPSTRSWSCTCWPKQCRHQSRRCTPVKEGDVDGYD